MAVKLRIDGIPLHAVLVHFPVAGWTAASLLAIAVVIAYPGLADIALYSNALALLIGAGAVGTGIAEFVSLPAEPQIRDHAARHMLLAASTWLLYLVMLLFQATHFTTGAATTGVLALAALIAAGHSGARLVFHHGIPRNG